MKKRRPMPRIRELFWLLPPAEYCWAVREELLWLGHRATVSWCQYSTVLCVKSGALLIFPNNSSGFHSKVSPPLSLSNKRWRSCWHWKWTFMESIQNHKYFHMSGSSFIFTMSWIWSKTICNATDSNNWPKICIHILSRYIILCRSQWWLVESFGKIWKGEILVYRKSCTICLL